MDASLYVLVIMKMLTSATIVVAASLVVERSGPFLGAMILTLPISAGPAFAFLAADHGAAFIAASALAGLPVSAATVIYMVVYATAAQRLGVLASVGAALGVWVVVVAMILKVQWSLGGALALSTAAYALALPFSRKLSAAAIQVAPKKRVWDVPFRAFLVMTVVGATLIAGNTLGPSVAGVAALAPVVLVSVALILQPRVGGAAAASVVANGVPSMLGFVGALSLVYLCAERFGAAVALILALAVSVGWNALLIALRRWRRAGADF